MQGAEGSGTAAVEAALVVARDALAALVDDKEKRAVMQSFIKGIEERIKGELGTVPSVPERRHQFVGRNDRVPLRRHGIACKLQSIGACLLHSLDVDLVT